MATTRKPSSTPADGSVPAYRTTTPTEPYDAPAEKTEARDDVQERETDQERETREVAEADQVVSIQSGFATREVIPPAPVEQTVPAAMNAATLDGMPVPVDRTFELVTDPHSGAIVSVPVDRDDKPADEKSDDESKKDEDKA